MKMSILADGEGWQWDERENEGKKKAERMRREEKEGDFEVFKWHRFFSFPWIGWLWWGFSRYSHLGAWRSGFFDIFVLVGSWVSWISSLDE